jgi:IclR family transcriptional regulator, pca regulon regulatory protein
MLSRTESVEEGPIGTLARGLHVLSRVAAARGPIGVTELAQRADLDKATTYRLACKLVTLGYLERDGDGKFRLGLHVLDLGFAYLASLDLRTQALPEMRRLHGEFDGAITLSVLDDTDIVYVERLSPKGLQASMPVGIGARLPVHCTAMGKVILANLAPDRLAALLDRIDYVKWTERTIGTRAEFESELERTRERGFGVTDQEMIDGLRAVASPIFDRHGTPIAALSVALPVQTWSLEYLLDDVAPRVIVAGKTISSHLGAERSGPSGVH